MMKRKADASHLDTDVQAHIGRQLRAGYIDILSQPVPDRFLDLLAELDAKELGFDSKDDASSSHNGVR